MTLFSLGQDIIDVLAADWETTDHGLAHPLPERRYVTNGMIIWDCEQLVVMVESTFGTEGDVAIEQALTEASMGFAIRAATIGVGMVRCVPDMEDDGTPPAWEDVQESAEVILGDGENVIEVLARAQMRGELVTCNGLAFERWSSEGPQGGLSGGVTRLRALLL